MSSETIDQLIINSPYEEPKQYWHYDRTSRLFNRAEGRRPAGYIIASESSKTFDDPGKFVEIPLVNQIRLRPLTLKLKLNSIQKSRNLRSAFQISSALITFISQNSNSI